MQSDVLLEIFERSAARGWTDKRLSEKSGVPQATISRIRNASQRIRNASQGGANLKTIEALAAALECRVILSENVNGSDVCQSTG